MRTRVRWTLTNEAGTVIPYASVRVYNADGETLYPGPIYRDAVADTLYTNPFNAAPVRLEFFLDQQVRIRLGIRTVADGEETLTPVLDAIADSDEVAYSINPLRIAAAEDQLTLRAASTSEAYWYRPGIGEHDHSGLGVDSVEIGYFPFDFSQISGYDQATILGSHDETVDPEAVLFYSWGSLAAQYPTWGSLDSLPWGTFDQSVQSVLSAPMGFRNSTAIGCSAIAAGIGATALGKESRAEEFEGEAGAVAIGGGTSASGDSVSIGYSSSATASGAVSLGLISTALDDGVAVGTDAITTEQGVSLGVQAASDVPVGSISLGSRATGPHQQAPSVMLGPGVPGAVIPEVDVPGAALLVQAFLSVLAPGDLRVQGDVALAGPGREVGFFGATPTSPSYVGNDEVASGIEALDSLIYALRDLGLIRARKDALVRYAPETLQETHLPGDQIRAWPDVDPARARLVTALGAEPTFTLSDAATFDASRVPWEFALAETPLSDMKHVVTVARHASTPSRSTEGLAGIYAERFRDRLVGDPIQPLARAGQSWGTAGLSGFSIDGQESSPQTPLDSRRHVYRATHAEEWESGSLVLGASGTSNSTGWWGDIAEAAVLDSSWREREVISYTTGLTFLHNGRGAAEWLTDPAIDFLRGQQGDQLSLAIQLDRDYASTTGKRTVQGAVSGFTGISTKSVPLVRVGNPAITLEYTYTGGISGYWNYLGSPQNYWVEVYSFPGEFTGTWSSSALAGRFALNAAGTWSTGSQRVPRGNKRWRLVLRSNLTPVTTDEWVPGAYYDTAIKIYTVNDVGTRTLEATVPLQGDGTWTGTTAHAGRVVAELCRRSTNAVLTTTDRHLPFDVVPRPADADYSSAIAKASIRTAALTVLAYLGAGQRYWSHAGDILRALAVLQQPDGALYTAYDVTVAPPAPYGATVAAHDMAWVGIAALRFGGVVGDHERFETLVLGIAEYLRGQQDPTTGSIPDTPGGTLSTRTSAVAWLFFRDLAESRGESLWRDVATVIATSLDDHHWRADLGRFTLSVGSTARDTRADAWGGLYQLATGQRIRAKRTLRSLAYGKIVGVSITDGYYGGATGLAGYLPTNTAGPHLIDHELTWVALLFKSRYGEPIGDDIATLRRWTAVTPTTSGGQFLSYSGSSGGLIVRPSSTVAAQAVLVAQRTTLFWPAPAPGPLVAATQLTVVHLAAGGYSFTYEWAPQDERQPTFFETVAERSFDNGATWVSMPSRSRSGQISEVRRTPDSVWPWLYGASWTEPGPLTNNTVTRVRIRMRANRFGSWASTEGRYPNGQVLS